MKKNVLILFRVLFVSIIFTLYSCDKSINGSIKDNFGVPLADVKITIPNSGFSAKTKKDGTFKLDYIAGEFDVVFKKEGYLTFNKSLKIAEHKNYPFGVLEMVKLPKTKGIFFIGKEDYVELPKVKLPYTKKEGYNIYGPYSIHEYYFPKDTLGLVLKLDTSTTLKFFDNNTKSAYLTRANDSRFMIKYTKGMSFTGGGSSRGIFVDTKQERIASGIQILDFKPTDYNRSYSFVEISHNDLGGEFMSGYGFCFTLVTDTIQ